MVNKHVRITLRVSRPLRPTAMFRYKTCDTTKHRFMNKSTDMSRKNIEFKIKFKRKRTCNVVHTT